MNCKNCIYMGYDTGNSGLITLCFFPDKRCGDDETESEGVIVADTDAGCEHWESNEEMEICPLCSADMDTPVDVVRCVKCRHFDEGDDEHCRLCGGENRLFECCEDCINDHWHWTDGEANSGTAREPRNMLF